MELLTKYFATVSETLPKEIIEKYQFIDKKTALWKIHFPKNKHDIAVAKERLAYEELYIINHRALSKKYESFKHSE